MTEWELQDQLTVQWIKSPLQFQGTSHFLVAWELMFPSWQINNNKKKWNEVSVDFIAFDGKETLACIELKNEIKGKRALLSAYCQVLHRSHLFREQYQRDKMEAAFDHCYDTVESYRIQSEVLNRPEVSFPLASIVQPILAARKFPEHAEKLIEEWGNMSDTEFRALVLGYAQSKELGRMLELSCARDSVYLKRIDPSFSLVQSV